MIRLQSVGGASAVFAALLLLFFPGSAPAQQPQAMPDRDAAKMENAPSSVPSNPAAGWVLRSDGATIGPAFGDAALESVGQGASPSIAADGAGNIDGAALVGGVPGGDPVTQYALGSATEGSLSSETTVVLLCGRENNWLLGADKALLPAEAPASWNVTRLLASATNRPWASTMDTGTTSVSAPSARSV